jgi:hypothetical protein
VPMWSRLVLPRRERLSLPLTRLPNPPKDRRRADVH